MRQETSKKIRIATGKLYAVAQYLKQELETQYGYRGKVVHDATNPNLIHFKIKEGTIAMIRENGILCVFDMPMHLSKTGMPIEFKTIPLEQIKSRKATHCKKCKKWRESINVTRCPCGGYIKPKTRFYIDESQIESWDDEFLEIQFAIADMLETQKIEWTQSRNKAKKYVPTGITPKLAGISSVQNTVSAPRMELLLIPKGEDLREIQVMSVESCSLLWVSAISSTSQGTSKMELLKKYNLEDVDFDEKSSENRKFASETKRFIVESSPETAKVLIDSWNQPVPNTSQRQSKIFKRTVKSLLNRNAGMQQKFIDGKYAKYSKKTYKRKPMFASSLPAPGKNQKVEVTN